MNKKKVRPIFTIEFKQSAVKLITEQGDTRQEAANNLGVSLSAITRWVRAETQVDSKLGSKQSTLNISERAELEILRKENNRLKWLKNYHVILSLFFLLAQLAVHKEFHNTGLGKISLIKALNYLWEVNYHMRAYAVVVDCLTDSDQRFYAKYGFEILCEHNGRIRMFLPMRNVE